MDSHSLKSEAVQTLFANASNEEKMNVISGLCQDIPYKEFLEHELIITKMKQRICKQIDVFIKHPTIGKLLTEDDIEFLKYLFMHENYTFGDIVGFFHLGFFEDILTYVHPSKWKFYHMDDEGRMFVECELLSQDQQHWKSFDFHRDVIKPIFPSSKIVRRWKNGNIHSWNIFYHI